MKYCQHGCYTPECGICVQPPRMIRTRTFAGAESSGSSAVPGVLLILALGAVAWKLRSKKRHNPEGEEGGLTMTQAAIAASALYFATKFAGGEKFDPEEGRSVLDATREEDLLRDIGVPSPMTTATTSAPAPSVEQESLAKSIVGNAQYPVKRVIPSGGGMNIDPTFTKGVDTRTQGVRQLTNEEMKQHQYVTGVMKESTPAYYQYASSSFGPALKTPEVSFVVGKR